MSHSNIISNEYDEIICCDIITKSQHRSRRNYVNVNLCIMFTLPIRFPIHWHFYVAYRLYHWFVHKEMAQKQNRDQK